MQPSVAILNTLVTIPKEERDILLQLMKEDIELFYETVLTLTRLRRIAESGNKKAWERMKQKEEKTMEQYQV